MANGVTADVEATGELTLELDGGFKLHLHDALYVPSLSRNLISVSCLADYGFDCHFGKEQCEIQNNNKCVGPAFRRDKLYMLSMHENVNLVCNESNIVCNSESSSSMNGKSKRKQCHSETSAKLWHCRLGHISRGRIERLIKEDILHPLDFSDVEYYIDCIKGKYVKQIKKGAKHRGFSR